MPRRFLLVFGLLLAACKSSEPEEVVPEDTSAVEVVVPLPRAAELPPGKLLRTSREADFESMRPDLVEADLVYVNLADDLPGGDLLPQTLLDQLFDHGRLHAIGLQIFDRTHQEALTEFSFARIDLDQLVERTGVVVGAYRPILEYAAERRLPLIALDLDRDLVAILQESGFKGLNEEQRRSISPATLRNPGFADALRRHLKRKREGAPSDAEFQRALLAADLRYETMADAIVRWRRAAPDDAQILVVTDRFAIGDRVGLPDRVRRRMGRKSVTLLQIAASEENDRSHNLAYADYVWLLPGKNE